jgi:hypothetical protein
LLRGIIPVEYVITLVGVMADLGSRLKLDAKQPTGANRNGLTDD